MKDAFRNLFGPAPEIRVFRAPGRVNLIGEHTDYNLGFVLPVALNLATTVATAPSNDRKLRIFSDDRQEMREFDAAQVPDLPPQHHWADYVVGVAQQLVAAGVPISPANLLIRSSVPEGAGLSSSAALEVSSALAFLNGRPFDKLELAKLCQRAERDYVGMPCGIMDQYISIFGRSHCAAEIDCRSLGHRMVYLPDGNTFIAVNTMVKHALGATAYRDRVRECAQAVAGIQAAYPDVRSLRDVTAGQLQATASHLPEIVARRARHIVTENARVNRFVDASAHGNVELMGSLMVESHHSLQHDYEVSCEELDFLVDAALSLPGVFGSRMTGGGFGGCTVTLLRSDAAADFTERIGRVYHERFGVTPAMYPCYPSDGAAEVA
jgi:galactokinase